MAQKFSLSKFRTKRGSRLAFITGFFQATLALVFTHMASADEGGVSFWLPGQYASFSAIAPEPGWSLPIVLYGYSGSASKTAPIGIGGSLHYGLSSDLYASLFVPTFTPDTTFLGARPSFSLTIAPAYNSATASANASGRGASRSDSVTGIMDLYPTGQLFWQRGAHNYMAYVTGAIPVGDYDASRLSNLGIGHAAIDIGGAYTFFDDATGWEVSLAAGLTHNFRNYDTGYQNGISAHLDAGLSRTFANGFMVGLAGYAYGQLTADKGSDPSLGDVKSQVFGLGPQISYTFDASGTPVFVSMRLYQEFNAKHRIKGSAMFLTISLPL